MNTKPIESSPFFRLKSKKKLSTLLGVSSREISAIIKMLDKDITCYYSVFPIDKKRQAEAPIGKLKRIHSRIKSLLSRTQTPSWLISGKKGKSIKDNALPHINANFVTCVDIEKFYKNVSLERVYQLFLHTFGTSPDVAYLLTKLVMYHDELDRYFIPTGSPCSQMIAFWAYYQTFSDIADYILKLGLTMTLYVDDLTLSFKWRISRKVTNNINLRLKRVGLSLKSSKIKRYGPHQHKVITGNCITPTHQLIPTRHLRREISNLVKNQRLSSLSPKQLKTIQGKIAATHLQDPNTFVQLDRKIKKLLKTKSA